MRTAPTDEQGTCLHACDANGGCLPRGGINQTCLPLLAADGPLPICLPGLFGYPCAADSNCVGDLVLPRRRSRRRSSARGCARPTTTAQGSLDDRRLVRSIRWRADLHPAAGSDEPPCSRDAQCSVRDLRPDNTMRGGSES